jgi:hypothetical protein
VTTFAYRYASKRGQTPYLVFASDNQIFNTTRADLANALSGNAGARASFIERDPNGDRAGYYARRLEYLKPNLVEIAGHDPATDPAAITPRHVANALQALHYRRVYEFALPDGQRGSLWYHAQPALSRT